MNKMLLLDFSAMGISIKTEKEQIIESGYTLKNEEDFETIEKINKARITLYMNNMISSSEDEHILNRMNNFIKKNLIKIEGSETNEKS